ncbi:MAG: carboxypeptidase regulatory-like domain-containing protein [Methanophagales archaeon]|nr:carboxypeptidase regulatory-like domain-containing protein [Methanophagales archaeon]
MKGDYSINNIATGTYTLTASKEGYIPKTVENVEVLEGQTTEVNFQLGGEQNMETYPIEILDGSKKTIRISVIEPTVPIEILNDYTGNPVPSRTIELSPVAGTAILQTQMTGDAGIATFTNIPQGLYNIRT